MIPHFYLFLFNSGLEDASIPYTALHVHFSVLLGYSTHLQSPSTLRRECFPHSSVGKEYACNAGDPGSILGLGRSSGGGIGYPLQYSWASLVAQLVKNLPAVQETWVRSLGWEDPLEKGKATHSSILAWRSPRTGTVHRVAESDTNE